MPGAKVAIASNGGAGALFDDVVLLNMRVVASGPTAEVFTRENLQKTYGGKLSLLEDAAEALRHVTR